MAAYKGLCAMLAQCSLHKVLLAVVCWDITSFYILDVSEFGYGGIFHETKILIMNLSKSL